MLISIGATSNMIAGPHRGGNVDQDQIDINLCVMGDNIEFELTCPRSELLFRFSVDSQELGIALDSLVRTELADSLRRELARLNRAKPTANEEFGT